MRDGWPVPEGHVTLAALQKRWLLSFSVRLYPTVDGTVKAEWWIGGYNVTLEVERDARYAEWSDYHFQCGN